MWLCQNLVNSYWLIVNSYLVEPLGVLFPAACGGEVHLVSVFPNNQYRITINHHHPIFDIPQDI